MTTSSAGSGQRRWVPARLVDRPTLGGRRVALGWVLSLGGPPLLTLALLQVRNDLWLPTDLMMFLTLVVATALVGGLAPSLVGAVLASAALNYFFTQPTGGLTIADPQNALALLVFMLVAVAVASVVDLAERRSVQAREARAEANALADLSRAVLAGRDAPQDLADELARRFGASRALVLERAAPGGPWELVAVHPGREPADRPASSGPNRVSDRGSGGATEPPEDGAEGSAVEAGGTRLVLPGHPLTAADRRVLAAFAAQASLVLDRQRFREAAERTRTLEQVDALRTALLTAASHDLRTPLASIRAAVDGLAAPGLALGNEDRGALVETIDVATSRLQRLVDNLLDLSRLQMGALTPALRVVSLDEVVPLALDGLDPSAVRLDLAESLPLALTDPGLLERVVANIAANAVRHSPPGHPARIVAESTATHLVVRVVDHGPGVPFEDRERMFAPFQRLDAEPSGEPARGPEGMGLGLAVARGLAEAIGVGLRVLDTPGGGLTVEIQVPRADVGVPDSGERP